MSDDDKLRELYRDLRTHDERDAPPFPWMRARAEARTRARRRRLVAWGALSAAGATALLVVLSARRAPVSAPTVTIAARHKPLEFLLQSPNATLLASVPDFDADPFAGTSRRVPRGFE